MKWKRIVRLGVLVVAAGVLFQCASSLSHVKFFDNIVSDLQLEQYDRALKAIELGKKEKRYTKKERVLYYLDKGAVHYYKGDYKNSVDYLEKADRAMEELFTKHISQIASSFLLNDNVMDYYGEIYENIYVNIFKALDYIDLNQPEDALVEVRRVNQKLQELDEKYGSMFDMFNRSDKVKAKVERQKVKFYNDALAHYISYLIYRADGAEDDSRIAKEKLLQAFQTQPGVYYYQPPQFLHKRIPDNGTPIIDVIAFTGPAPVKKAVGGLITTYEDYIGISDLTQPIALPNIPFPGMKPGYHFKFAFPVIERQGSKIAYIKVYIDGKFQGELELLEDMGKVAEYTFQDKRNYIYLKTLIRTITKGIAAAKAKEKLRKESGNNPFLNAVINAAVDVGVDASEQPDVRCWRTMPQNCYVGEFLVEDGMHTIRVDFLTREQMLVKSKEIRNYKMNDYLNLLDFVSLN